MYTEIENHGFYKIVTWDKTRLDLLSQLADLLPHGSGINSNWYLSSYKYHGNIYLRANNTYSAMDEWGGYCHDYKFSAKYLYNEADYTNCPICEGRGYRPFSDMRKYHPDMNDDQMKVLLSDNLNNPVFSIRDNQPVFSCNSCNGFGNVPLPKFDLQMVKVTGREFICCGYDLSDYLYQTLEYLGKDNNQV